MRRNKLKSNFKKRTIYLVCRGTKAKSGLIAEKYNLQDRKSTHVGIGFFHGNNFKIYHITDTKSYKGSALIIEDLYSYLIDQKNVYYLSIWECQTDFADFVKAKKLCQNYAKSSIKFDKSFSLENKNELYCSEFCSEILHLTNPNIFNFKPSKVELDKFYKMVLKRDFLIYYPIDFFQHNKNIIKIFEKEI